MVLALLERAQPDGGGLNLHLCPPTAWIHPDASVTALETFGSPYLWVKPDSFLRPIALAFDGAQRREGDYRARLPRELACCLLEVPGDESGLLIAGALPVRELLQLVAAYVLTPIISHSPL
jgi:hypothetical protein